GGQHGWRREQGRGGGAGGRFPPGGDARGGKPRPAIPDPPAPRTRGTRRSPALHDTHAWPSHRDANSGRQIISEATPRGVSFPVMRQPCVEVAWRGATDDPIRY